MASRDYLIRQIEEMGLFLSSLLRKVLKLKDDKQPDQIESVVKESLFQELKFDIDQVVMLGDDDFLAIVSKTLTKDDQIEQLADIMRLMGEDIGQSYSLSKAGYLRKALFLYMTIQNRSTDFSFDRKMKIDQLQEQLRVNGLFNE